MSHLEGVIGLEVHAQLLTRSKMFCSCPTAFGGEPNVHLCPVCLGLPGALPVLNREAVGLAIRVALALGCRVRGASAFSRKHYFYPDLPKGYQITQYDLPLADGGMLEIEIADERRAIGITRVHLEEDAGKSFHDGPSAERSASGLDFNRAGVPLIEIVSEPDLRSPEEAYAYLRRLRQVLTYLKACSGRMEEGALRCDANVSIRRPDGAPGQKVEVKNLNSFRNVQRALAHEVDRQGRLVSAGLEVVRETRLFDAALGETVPMRAKEEADDYRYFPEPDLPPLRVEQAWLVELGGALPEMPAAKKERYVQAMGLSPRDADVIIGDPDLASYFESVASASADARAAANWVLGEVLREAKAREISADQFPVRPKALADLLGLISCGALSVTAAKDVFGAMVETGEPPGALAERMGLRQIVDEKALLRFVDRALAEHAAVAEEFRSGKEKVLGFLVGQVMKLSKGRADPAASERLIRGRLRS